MGRFSRPEDGGRFLRKPEEAPKEAATPEVTEEEEVDEGPGLLRRIYERWKEAPAEPFRAVTGLEVPGIDTPGRFLRRALEKPGDALYAVTGQETGPVVDQIVETGSEYVLPLKPPPPSSSGGFDRLKGLPGRAIDQVVRNFTEPADAARAAATALVPHKKQAASELSVWADPDESAAARAVFEATTGTKWLSTEELSALSENDPEAARLQRNRQSVGLRSSADSLVDLKRAIPELAIAGVEGISNFSKRLSQGDFSGAIGAPLDTAAHMGAGMLESYGRTMTGDVRADPVSSLLDAAGTAASIKALPGTVGAVRATEGGLGAKARTAWKAQQVGESRALHEGIRGFGEVVDQTPFVRRLTSDPGATPSLIDRRRTAITNRQGGDARIAREAHELAQFSPEDQARAMHVTIQGVEDTPAKYRAMEVQSQLRKMIDDPGARMNRALDPVFADIDDLVGRGMSRDEAVDALIRSEAYLKQFDKEILSGKVDKGLARRERDLDTAEHLTSEAARAIREEEIARGRLEDAGMSVVGSKLRQEDLARAAQEGSARVLEEAARRADQTSVAAHDLDAQTRALLEETRTTARRIGDTASPARIEGEVTRDIRTAESTLRKANPLLNRGARRGLFDDALQSIGVDTGAEFRLRPNMSASIKLLDDVNERLGLRGRDRVKTPEEAWRRLTRFKPTGNVLEDALESQRILRRAEEVMQGIYPDLRIDHSGLASAIASTQDVLALDRDTLRLERWARALDNPLLMSVDEARRDFFRLTSPEKIGRLKERIQHTTRARRAALTDWIRKEAAAARGPGAVATQSQIRQAEVIGERVAVASQRAREAKAAARAAARASTKATKAWARLSPDPRKSLKRGVDLIVDTAARDEQIRRFEQTGAVLRLDDDAVNTVAFSLSEKWAKENMLDAVADGRLRFVPAPGADPAIADMMNRSVLWGVAMNAEQAKEMTRLGMLPASATRANLLNYVAAFYDQADAAIKKLAESQAAERAMTARIEQMRAAKLPQAQIDEFVRIEAPKVRKIAEEVSLHHSGAKRAGATGMVDASGLQRAEFKYEPIEAQLEKGRRPPERFAETFVEQLIRNNRLISEHQLLEWAADNLATTEPAIVGLSKHTHIRPGLGRENVLWHRVGGKKYAQVPTTTYKGSETLQKGGVPQYGKLAGKWIALDDLEALERALAYKSTWWRRFSRTWRQNRIILNPPSQFNQAMEVNVKTVFDGGNPIQLYEDLEEARAAMRDPKNASEMFRVFSDHGGIPDYRVMMAVDQISEGSRYGRDIFELSMADLRYAAGEYGRDARSTLRALAKHPGDALMTMGGPGVLTAFEMGSDWIAKHSGMRGLFEAHEYGSRYSAFKRYIRRVSKETGLSEKVVLESPVVRRQAMEHVRKFNFDYTELPRWVEYARQAPFGLPFLAYPIKATGLVTRLMVENPKITRAMLEAERAQITRASPEKRAQRSLADPWTRGTSIPIGDEWNVDVKAASPAVVWPLTEVPRSPEGTAGIIHGLGGPGVSVFEALENFDRFHRSEVYGEYDDVSERAVKMLMHIIAGEGPGFIGHAIRLVENKLRGGKPVSTEEKVLRSLGLKVSPSTPGYWRERAENAADRALREIERDWEKSRRTPADTARRERKKEQIIRDTWYRIGHKEQ